MNIYNLICIAVLLQDNINYASSSMYFQKYSLTLDITESEKFKPTILKLIEKQQQILVKFPL